MRGHHNTAENIVLDEPAARMNNDETRDLINFLRALHKQTGLAILIGHHLEVVMELCRDITVLNNWLCWPMVPRKKSK
ncbi:MAG: hypothetical protein ACLRI7_11385 [Ruthenibacterium lactatiformans]